MRKILIVEDEPDIRESLADLLTMKGFEVVTASNGKEGLYLASTSKPDLILSDIMMPEMNGFDLLELIQKNNELAALPFIFLTAKIEHASLREGMNLGADDYLLKPVKKDELIEVINRRLQKADHIKKQYEEELKSVLNQLNRSAQHEFNTPLNGILGFAELLKSKPAISPEHIKHFAEIIEQSGLRLKTILDNMVLYRAIITGNIEKRTDTITLDEETLETIACPIAEKYERLDDLRIQLNGSHKFDGAVNIFEKILFELIDNAFKFSKKGEPVSIYTQSGSQRHEIGICDHGRGLTDEQISKIGAFIQFDREKYEQQGLGLGLFLSKELARESNWKIEVLKNNPEGLTCRVYV